MRLQAAVASTDVRWRHRVEALQLEVTALEAQINDYKQPRDPPQPHCVSPPKVPPQQQRGKERGSTRSPESATAPDLAKSSCEFKASFPGLQQLLEQAEWELGVESAAAAGYANAAVAVAPAAEDAAAPGVLSLPAVSSHASPPAGSAADGNAAQVLALTLAGVLEAAGGAPAPVAADPTAHAGALPEGVAGKAAVAVACTPEVGLPALPTAPITAALSVAPPEDLQPEEHTDRDKVEATSPPPPPPSEPSCVHPDTPPQPPSRPASPPGSLTQRVPAQHHLKPPAAPQPAHPDIAPQPACEEAGDKDTAFLAGSPPAPASSTLQFQHAESPSHRSAVVGAPTCASSTSGGGVNPLCRGVNRYARPASVASSSAFSTLDGSSRVNMTSPSAGPHSSVRTGSAVSPGAAPSDHLATTTVHSPERRHLAGGRPLSLGTELPGSTQRREMLAPPPDERGQFRTWGCERGVAAATEGSDLTASHSEAPRFSDWGRPSSMQPQYARPWPSTCAPGSRDGASLDAPLTSPVHLGHTHNGPTLDTAPYLPPHCATATAPPSTTAFKPPHTGAVAAATADDTWASSDRWSARAELDCLRRSHEAATRTSFATCGSFSLEGVENGGPAALNGASFPPPPPSFPSPWLLRLSASARTLRDHTARVLQAHSTIGHGPLSRLHPSAKDRFAPLPLHSSSSFAASSYTPLPHPLSSNSAALAHDTLLGTFSRVSASLRAAPAYSCAPPCAPLAPPPPPLQSMLQLSEVHRQRSEFQEARARHHAAHAADLVRDGAL
jgi:hypothetical protein